MQRILLRVTHSNMTLEVIILTIILFSNIFIILQLLRAGGKRERKKRVLFVLTNIGVVIWVLSILITDIFFRNIFISLWASRISFFASALIALFFEDFVRSFRKTTTRIGRFISYIWKTFFCLLSLGTLSPLVVREVVVIDDSSLRSENGVLYQPFALFIFIYFVYSLYLFYNTYTKEENRVIKTQIRFILIGSLISIVASLATNLFLPILEFPEIRYLGPLSLIAFLFFTYYSILRYRFLRVRMIIGRTVYITFIALIPFIAFYAIFFIQTSVWGSIFSTGAIITGFFIAMLFIYFLLFANTELSKFINAKIINPGFDPSEEKEKLIHKLSSELDTSKVVTNILSIFHSTIRPEGSGIIIIDLNNRKVLFRRIRDLKLGRGIRDLLEIIYYWDDFGASYPIIREEIEVLEINLTGKLKERLKRIMKFMKKNKVAAIFPLNRKVHLNGILLLGEKQDESAFTVQDVNFIESIVANASVAIGRSLLYEQVEDFAKNLERKVDKATKELERKAKLLERKNKALKMASQRERDMMDIVGHELRTPSSIVKNALGYMKMLIRMRKLTKQKTVKYIDTADEAIDREIKLINTFLGATKIEGGQMQLDPSKFSMVELVKQVVKENRERAEEKKLKLLYRQTRKLIPPIEADRTRIAEVVDNLISNAIKYTHEGNIELWCGTDAKKETVTVYVKDTGVGIPVGDKKKLFTKFGRIRNYTTQKKRMAQIVRPGGTGLGLYLVKGIVKLHGGEINVKSNVGKGSTFFFTLPIKHKITKENLLNPIFSKRGEKEVFSKLGLSKEDSINESSSS
ncbi:hypothetical protein JW766_06345 [Candidatus Dojkabacteria bacterium]|nr:hypothetical protein [Candidatus Dojkabacteria bacterium]